MVTPGAGPARRGGSALRPGRRPPSRSSARASPGVSIADERTSTICFVILAATVVVFVWDYLPVAVRGDGGSRSLAVGNRRASISTRALAGFGDPAVLFIGALFVVSEALDATGVTAWAGQELINRSGDSRPRLIIFTMLLAALLTALIKRQTGAVAALAAGRRRDGDPARAALDLAAAAAAGLRRARRLAPGAEPARRST